LGEIKSTFWLVGVAPTDNFLDWTKNNATQRVGVLTIKIFQKEVNK